LVPFQIGCAGAMLWLVPEVVTLRMLGYSGGLHHPFRDMFWNSAGSMFADDFLATLFDCPM
jgi:hypothetical protein